MWAALSTIFQEGNDILKIIGGDVGGERLRRAKGKPVTSSARSSGSTSETPMRSPIYIPGYDVIRSMVADRNVTGGYLMRSDGALYAFGLAVPLPVSPATPGRDLMRDLTLNPQGLGGWRLDAYGGIHPFGGAPAVVGTGYWPGWQIARSIAANPSGPGGWVLDGFGGLHPFGGAPRVSGNPGYRPTDAFRDLVMLSSTGGYAIDTDGVPWPIGDAPPISVQLTSFGAGLGRALVA